MLKFKEKKNFYIYVSNTRAIKEQLMNVATRQQQAERVNNANKPVETVETAGSLALMPMGQKSDYLAMNSYDTFTTSNPVSIDYASYADCGDSSVSSSGFLSSFSTAVASIGTAGCAVSAGCSAGGSVSSGSCGGFSSFC